MGSRAVETTVVADVTTSFAVVTASLAVLTTLSYPGSATGALHAALTRSVSSELIGPVQSLPSCQCWLQRVKSRTKWQVRAARDDGTPLNVRLRYYVPVQQFSDTGGPMA